MSDHTGISWTDSTWNPVTGCTKVSAGCKNCYAEAVAERYWSKQYGGDRKFTDVRTHADRLDQPLRWRKPRRVFVNSMSDLFHDAVPDEFIGRVFDMMAMADRHTFQVLTKRPQRMRDLLLRWEAHPGAQPRRTRFSNVWLGISCEDQRAADERIPLLLETPAAVRFLSCEPLLGPINLLKAGLSTWPDSAFVDWVIVGGESGPQHRPMNLAWARDLREQCRRAEVPFFFKQTSGPRSGMSEDALGERIQQFPLPLTQLDQPPQP